MSTYKINGYKINLKNTYKSDRWDNKYYIQYSLVSPTNEILFSGKDFQSSPLYPPTGKDSAMDLLGFLTLQLGDTDNDYFKNYTERQLTWINSNDAEDLRLYVYDYENPE